MITELIPMNHLDVTITLRNQNLTPKVFMQFFSNNHVAVAAGARLIRTQRPAASAAQLWDYCLCFS